MDFRDDGFYKTQSLTVRNSSEFIYKSWNFDKLDFTLKGLSGLEKKGFVVSSVEILIFSDDWKGAAPTKLRNLEGYKTISSFDVSPNNKEIFMTHTNGSLCYDIYDLTPEELKIFKERYKQKAAKNARI